MERPPRPGERPPAPPRAALLLLLAALAAGLPCPPTRGSEKLFRDAVAPLLEARCLECHGPHRRQGKLALHSAETLRRGGRSGPAVVPGEPEESLLLQAVRGPDPEMPRSGGPLSDAEVETIRAWIAAGAPWPAGLELEEPSGSPGGDWWSLQPPRRPPLPELSPEEARQARTPVDAFILAKHRELGLGLSPEADRRTLIRRLYHDLLGLPPPPEEIERFSAAEDPLAYEKLVDRLLASPRHGERWGRHWLDVARYADTHGYDKDKPRPYGWPYRDYVIRAFNEDRPYTRFVKEQIAGDVLYPGTAEGITATGFIAAGPWDSIGHAEVPESKIDGKIARNLDRDEMVTAALTAFASLTVGCARCHDHKFDPVTQEDYYSLQAVFAALDRADRPYDPDPQVAARRSGLEGWRAELEARRREIDGEIERLAGAELAALDRRLEERRRHDAAAQNPAFGYHSAIESGPGALKWVQVDLGASLPIARVIYTGCHDDFNGIGAGFGFPPRFKVEAANDPRFLRDVTVLEDRTGEDVPNPGVAPRSVEVSGVTARYVRFTATRLSHRRDDYIFALAELLVLGPDGANAALGRQVAALDSIEAPVRWSRHNLVDGYYPGMRGDPAAAAELARLEAERAALLERAAAGELAAERSRVARELEEVKVELEALPAPALVYAGCIHRGSGAFSGTGPQGGKPREIRVLQRGDVRAPGKLVGPGVPPLIDGVPARFELPPKHGEGERRRALAQWLVHERHPLTWRSIANRVWQHHFGRGIVETPNDFGRMGARPTHPELLDWLACEIRDGGGSLKRLHRLIVLSATYRQSSAWNEAAARIDAENRHLWRMNRRRLDAEALRDSILEVSGRLDLRMYGPGFRCFVLEKPEHSPHYEYGKHDPDEPAAHRRSVYRFIVRSQPDPFMDTLDCADASRAMGRREETLTALQALALLNNPFVLRMAEHLAERLESATGDLPGQLALAFRLVAARPPSPGELEDLLSYARRHGLTPACRLLFNLNELIFVD